MRDHVPILRHGLRPLRMHVDLATLSPNAVYATMTQTIVPRPVAWITSLSEAGVLNLAPFSYFNAMASDPPLVVVSLGLRPDGSVKDTRRNIEAGGAFVVNIAHREMAEAMTASSATLAEDVSEVERLGLETAPMPGTDVPRLAACRVAYACRHEETKAIGGQRLVFARLTDLWLDDAVVGEDAKGRLKVDARAVDPIGRLGGGEYVTFGEIVSIPRPA